jgi:hypothetical protein
MARETDPSAEAVRDALAVVRQALEEVLPPGWVRPADETPAAIAAEIDAIVSAIRAMAAAIPPERLDERVV